MQIRKDVAVHGALQTLVGDMAGKHASEDEDEYHELMEWIDMVTLGAEEVFEEKTTEDRGATAPKTAIRVLSFQGLLSPEKMFQVLIGMM
jgi:hypothetical protein